MLMIPLLGTTSQTLGDEPVPDTKAKEDIRLIIGGNFDVDHLGPKWYGEVRDRAVQNAKLYVEVFRKEYLGEKFECQRMSNLGPNILFELTTKSAPEETKNAASDLRRDINNCLFLYDLAEDKKKFLDGLTEEDGRTIERLKRLRASLQ
jgi:hypothetical protein